MFAMKAQWSLSKISWGSKVTRKLALLANAAEKQKLASSGYLFAKLTLLRLKLACLQPNP